MNQSTIANPMRMSPSTSHSGSASDASVDEERVAVSHHGGAVFGNDPSFHGEKLKLAKRVAAEEVSVGDVDHKTKLTERIGGGSFGEIYLGEMIIDKRPVAVKVEPTNCVMQYLLHEGNVYRKLEGGPGIPRVHWFGLHGADYAMMVMDLLGPTLYTHWVKCNQMFTIKTVLMVIDQMIDVIAHVHQNSFVHRDISPSNFMFGVGEQSGQLFLIDFGHAKKVAASTNFVPASRMRYTITKPRPLVGTPRFASVFAHAGFVESYRDDMESLGFIWIYLLKGKLPWQGLKVNVGENKLDLIARMKMNTPLEVLCDGLPEEFSIYMNYVRGLKLQQMPDHVEIRRLFQSLASRLHIEYDGQFDWSIWGKNNLESPADTSPSVTEFEIVGSDLSRISMISD